MPFRLFALTTALVLTASACAQPLRSNASDSDPGEAVSALIQRLHEADAVSFRFALNEPTATEDDPTTLDGMVEITAEQQVRIESSGYVNGLGATPSLISDGRVMTGGRNGFLGFTDFTDEDVPPTLTADLVSTIVRWGIFYPLGTLVRGDVPGFNSFELGPDDEILVGDPLALLNGSGYAWGTDETIEGTATRPVSFTMTHPYYEYDTHVTLWLSMETGLPVRQTVLREIGESPDLTEITYADWSFEPIPASRFVPEESGE